MHYSSYNCVTGISQITDDILMTGNAAPTISPTFSEFDAQPQNQLASQINNN